MPILRSYSYGPVQTGLRPADAAALQLQLVRVQRETLTPAGSYQLLERHLQQGRSITRQQGTSCMLTAVNTMQRWRELPPNVQYSDSRMQAGGRGERTDLCDLTTRDTPSQQLIEGAAACVYVQLLLHSHHFSACTRTNDRFRNASLQ